VKEVDASLLQLIEDMIETMGEANGVGLAANQVGVPLRVCIIHLPDEEDVLVLINPEIILSQGERELEEGCLSIPGYRGTVTRSQKVRVRAQDITGKRFRIKAEDDLLAQALEHEIGHLNGQLYIDHLVRKDAIWPIDQEEMDDDEDAEEGRPTEAGSVASAAS
jgi:peptide deformylase